jgi:hypothetical protein
MLQTTSTIAQLNIQGIAPSRPAAGAATEGVQRLELTLKKIGDLTEGGQQRVPLSSACTSGCFSSVSSISVQGSDLNTMDEAQIEQVIRLHDKALSVMGQDALAWSGVAKGLELGLTK